MPWILCSALASYQPWHWTRLCPQQQEKRFLLLVTLQLLFYGSY